VKDTVNEFESMRIGEILIARGKLDAAGVERALRLQQEGGEKLGSLLVTLGLCAQRDVCEALAAQLGLQLVDAAGYPEFPIMEERISPRFLREAHALPLKEDARELALAMADPTDAYTIGAFRMATGREVKPLVAIPRNSMPRSSASTAPGARPSARSSAMSSSATSSRSTPMSSS
jgi:general secretion pathway protein E